MSDMPQHFPHPPRKRRTWRAIVYTLPYVFILYVLSVGPLYWQIYAAFFLEGSAFLRWFYFPLVLACEIDYIANFFDWYLQFWI